MLNFIPDSLNQAVENLISPIRIFHPDNFARTVIGNLGFGGRGGSTSKSNFIRRGDNPRFTLDDDASENVDKNLNINKEEKSEPSGRLIERLDELIRVTEKGFDKNNAILSSLFEIITAPPSDKERPEHEPTIEAMQAFELYKRETDSFGLGETGSSSFMHFTDGDSHVPHNTDPKTRSNGNIGTIVKDILEGTGLLAVGGALRKLLSDLGRFLPKSAEPLPKPPPPEPAPPGEEPLPEPPPPEPAPPAADPPIAKPPEIDKNGRRLPPRDEKGRFTKPKVSEDISKPSLVTPEESAAVESDLLGAGGEELAEAGSLAIPGVGEVVGVGLAGLGLYNVAKTALSGSKADKELRHTKSEIRELQNRNKNIQQSLKYLDNAHASSNEIMHYVEEYHRNEVKIEQLKKAEPALENTVHQQFNTARDTPYMEGRLGSGFIPRAQTHVDHHKSPVFIHHDNRVTNNYNGSNKSAGEGDIKTYHTSPADSSMITPTKGR